MPKSKDLDINMSEERFLHDLRIGCIRLRNADSLPIASSFVVLSKTDVSITFWGATPEPWDGVSLVSIRMFQLPRFKAEFQREIKWFSDKRKKRARLPEGVAFEENTLAMRGVPANWVHEGFARSGRDFIHTYETDKLAILIRFLGKAGNILDNPLLKQIHENLSIVENQWIVEFPKTKPQKRTQSVIAATPLAPEVQTEVLEAVGRARELLDLGRIRNPRKAAEAVYRALDEMRARKRVPAKEKKQLAIDIGALWGDALCKTKKWEWCCVRPTADQEIYAICSMNRSHAVDPIGLVHRILSSRRVPNNSLLLFNMIVSGPLPKASDQVYFWLS